MSYLTNIPDEFHQDGSGKLIENCKMCNKELLDSSEAYVLEKAIKKFPEIEAREVIFEYAICMGCAQESRKSLSKQSIQDIEEFLSSDEVKSNLLNAMEASLTNGASMLDYCIVTGAHIDEVEEYQIMAHCNGKKLSQGTQAFMISGKGLEIINELLSAETRDELDRLKDEHFGVPPEFDKILNPTDLVFL